MYSKEREVAAKVVLEGQEGDGGGHAHRGNGMPTAEVAEQVAMRWRGRRDDHRYLSKPSSL